MKKILLSLIAISCLPFFSTAQNVHLSEDFDACSSPAGWTNTAASGSLTWSFGIDGAVAEGGNNNIDGTCFAYFDDDLAGNSSLNNTVELLTPVMNLSGETTAFLEFDYNYRDLGGVSDTFKVEVFDGTNWVNLLNVTSNDCGRYTVGACLSGFPHATYDVSSYINAAFQVRFTYHDGDDWCWYVGLDNVEVYSPFGNDVLVSSIIRPESGCGLTATDTVEVMINNIGSQAATGFNVAFAIGGTQIASETVSQSIPSGDSLLYKFTATANLSATGNYDLDAYTIWASDLNASNDTSSVIVQNFTAVSPTYTEGFETGAGGWIASGTNSSWALGAPNGANINTAAGGTQAWVTNLTGPYNNSELSYLTSPCLDFSGAIGDPTVGFSLIYRTETNFDQAWMELSTDNGLTWNKLMPTVNAQNWYNNTNDNVWEGVSAGWLSVENILTGVAGSSNVRVRMVFSSDGSVSLEGIGFDNFYLVNPQPIDIQTRRLVAPVTSSGCGLAANQTITMEVLNKGATPITAFDASYQINGGAIVTENVTGVNIAPNTLYNYSFTQTGNFAAPGNYNIDIWAKVTGDPFALNDSSLMNTVANNSIPQPFTSDFENDPSSFNAITVTSEGWVQNNPNATVTWRVNSGSTGSFGTGPDFDHTTGTAQGKYVYIETSTATSTTPAILTSPCINLGNASGANLSFWYHMFGATIGTLKTEIFNGVSWIPVDSITGQQQTANADPWRERVVSLSQFAGQSIQIRFLANRTTSFTGDISLDDILIFEPIPQDARVSDITSPTSGCGLDSNSVVTIEVQNFGTAAIAADSVRVFYQVDNRTPVMDTVNQAIPIGGSVVHTFTTGANLSIPSRTYRFTVWTELFGDTNLGNDTLGDYEVTNNTKVSPYFEDFETFVSGGGTGDILQNGWTRNPDGTGVSWNVGAGSTPSFNTGPAADHTTGTGAGTFMFLETSPGGGPSTLTMPCVDLTNVNGAILSFWYHKFGAGMGDLFVDVQDQATGVWTNGVDGIPGQTQNNQNDPWLERVTNLTQFAGSEISIRFRGFDAAGFTGDMAIDDVLLYEPIPQDARLFDITAPVSDCDLAINEDVIVVIENFGTANIDSIFLYYQIDNGPINCDSIYGQTIIPGAQYTHTFTQKANLSTPGPYVFKAWTSLPGDSNVGNDTLGGYVVVNETKIFPYVLDFEASTVGANATGVEDDWVLNPENTTADFRWNVDAGGTPNGGTGPLVDHTLGTAAGRYLFTEASSGIAGNIASLTSPCFDLTQVPVANLEFWYHMFGNNTGNIYVDIFDGNLWNNGIDSLVGSQQTAQAQPWRKKTISVSNFVGDFINIRFRGQRGNGFSGDMAIDDIALVPPPPQQIAVEAVIRPLQGLCFYSNAEDIRVRSKNVGGDRIDSIPYTVRLYLNNVLIDDTTEIARPSSGGTLFTPGDFHDYIFVKKFDMSAYGNYRIEVEANLPGDVEPADDIVDDYTFVHNDPTDFPFSDGFENLNLGSGPTFANGFSSSTGQYEWVVERGNNHPNLTGPSIDHTIKTSLGKYFVTEAANGSLGNVAVLETQCLDLQNVNAPTLQFWYHKFGFDMGDMFIDINDDSGWVTADSILGETQFANNEAWKLRVIDLTSYKGKVIRVRWRGIRGGGAAGNMAIDDIFLFDVSDYDIGPSALIEPNEGQFQCYSAQQDMTIELRNYGSKDLDFTQDSMKVRVQVDIQKNGLPLTTLVDTLDNNANNFFGLPLKSDSVVQFVMGTFDMSDVGATYSFDITTSMLKDSIITNDNINVDVVTAMTTGTIAIDNNSVCNGTSIQLSATGFRGAIQWQRQVVFPGGATVWVDLNTFGSDSASVVVLPDTSTLYRYTICDQLISDSIFSSVTVVRAPIGVHDTVCGSGTLNLGTIRRPNIDFVRWYENEDDSVHFYTGNSYSNFYSQTDTLWLEGWDDSCKSLTREPVYAVVNPFPVVSLVSRDTLCADTSLVLNAGPGEGFTYQWYSTDTLVNGSNLQTIGVDGWRLEVGTTYIYAVTITSPFDCVTLSDTSFITIEDSCIVGIGEFAFLQEQLSIYPNPSQGLFTIEMNAQTELRADMSIHAISGKVVYEETNVPLGSLRRTIDLGTLPKGIYFLKLNSEEGYIVRKLVIS